MKRIAFTVLAALTMGSIEAQAADYGIGISVQSNDSILYAPIEIDDKFRIEPSIRYRKDELSDDLETERLELGVGLFALSPLNKSVRLYYGGRVSYIDQETTQTVLQGPIVVGPGVILPNTPATVTIDSDGFRAAATIGFEFLFNERLSLGGEGEYFFQEANGDLDTKSTGTDTRLILRFKF